MTWDGARNPLQGVAVEESVLVGLRVKGVQTTLPKCWLRRQRLERGCCLLAPPDPHSTCSSSAFARLWPARMGSSLEMLVTCAIQVT